MTPSAIERRILEQLAEGPKTAWELQQLAGVGESVLFSAIGLLRREGLITAERTKRGYGNGSGQGINIYRLADQGEARG